MNNGMNKLQEMGVCKETLRSGVIIAITNGIAVNFFPVTFYRYHKQIIYYRDHFFCQK